MKRFKFLWYANVKHGEPFIRETVITVPAKNDYLGVAAKRATDLLCSNFGSLKKITIISIQEIDEEGNAIGEPITPAEGSSIVPTAK